MPFELSHNSYGKSVVRLTKVMRDGPTHELLEFSIDIQLQGDFAETYISGNNADVVATDSMKNTVYVLGKENDFTSPEAFASILARHFCSTYSQVTGAEVEIRQSRWKRIQVNDQEHDHAFVSAGPDLRWARASLHKPNTDPVLQGGVRGLTVMKTTGSEFAGFVTDRYRTLKDSHDRIFATTIDADWLLADRNADFNHVYEAARDTMLQVFAKHYSLSVQQTLLAMGESMLEGISSMGMVTISMPNRHRIPVNLEPFGLDFQNDIFVATDEPHGLIKGTVVRKA